MNGRSDANGFRGSAASGAWGAVVWARAASVHTRAAALVKHSLYFQWGYRGGIWRSGTFLYRVAMIATNGDSLGATGAEWGSSRDS